MDHKIKLGLSASQIVAIIFGVMGLIYLPLGVGMLSASIDAEEKSAAICFAILGGGFLTAALFLFVYSIFQKRRIQKMVDAGTYVWGEVTDIVPNYNVRINSRNPFMLLVRYQDRTGNIHIFHSQNLKTYPDRSVIGKQVKVYYENETYKHYYVDAENVLPKVIEH